MSNKFTSKKWVRLNLIGFIFLILFHYSLITIYASKQANIFTPFTKVVLENGLTVIIKEIHTYPIAAIDIRVATGTRNDTDTNAGISHFFEHMLFKGTQKRKSGEIAKQIESVGGRLNAETSLDTTHFNIVVPSEYIDLALDVEADGIMYSSFDLAEIERERKVILEEIRLKENDPINTLRNTVIQKLFIGTPYANSLSGTPQTLNNITRDTFLTYYQKYYIPNNMVVAVVGDVDTKQIVNRLRELFKDFKSQKKATLDSFEIPKQKEIVRVEIQQPVNPTYLYFGFPGPGLTAKDNTAMEVLRVLLGNCKTARLNVLQWQKQIANKISADYIAFKEAGIFTIYVQTQNVSIADIEKEITSILNQLINDGISDNELNNAKAILNTQFTFSLEKRSTLANIFSNYAINDSIETGINHEIEIQKVSKDDVVRVARKYLNPEIYVLAIVKPQEVK